MLAIIIITIQSIPLKGQSDDTCTLIPTDGYKCYLAAVHILKEFGYGVGFCMKLLPLLKKSICVLWWCQYKNKEVYNQDAQSILLIIYIK